MITSDAPINSSTADTMHVQTPSQSHCVTYSRVDPEGSIKRFRKRVCIAVLIDIAIVLAATIGISLYFLLRKEEKLAVFKGEPRPKSSEVSQ